MDEDEGRERGERSEVEQSIRMEGKKMPERETEHEEQDAVVIKENGSKKK